MYLALGAGTALAAGSPTVTTGAAKSITGTTVSLTATVNPDGLKTDYNFQYGTTTAFGAQTTTEVAGSGTANVGLSAGLTGLTPGTTYYYRVNAGNADGSTSGSTKTFRTAGNPPPTATTGAPQALTTTGVTLSGVIAPQDEITTYYFNYGLTAAYGLRTATAAVPAGTAPVTVTTPLTGLAPGTTFHYQLVAQHGSGAPILGADETFETFPSPAPTPRVMAVTRPRVKRHRPFAFVTDGRIVNPSATPPALACTGTAEITLRYGRRPVGRVIVPIQADCTYAGGVTLKHMPGHAKKGQSKKGRTVKLSVTVHFSGNDYLAAADADKATITLG
jgi:hypothetical protein